MSRQTVSKTLRLLRVMGGDEQNFLLNGLHAIAKKRSPDPNDDIDLGANVGVLRLADLHASASALQVRIIRVTSDAQTTVTTGTGKASIHSEPNEHPFPPPAGEKYKDGEFFMRVDGDDAIVCAHDISVNAATLYLRMLAEHKGVRLPFTLDDAQDRNKVALLKNGVKSLKLAGTSFQGDIDRDHLLNPKSMMLGSVAEKVRSLFAKEKSEEDLQELADLKISVTLHAKGGMRADPKLLKGLGQLAVAVCKDDKGMGLLDQYEITPASGGETIKLSEVLVRKSIKVPFAKNWNNLDAATIWGEMSAYRTEIERDGLSG